MEGRFDFSRLMKKASLAGAFFVSAIWLSAAQAFCPAPAGLTSVSVQRVVDGDTLRLSDGRNVRMIGLNTPELGKQAKDHYGRTLAHVYSVSGVNLEAQMLADGLGFHVAVAPNVDLVACQQAAERSARRAGLGLWRQAPVQKAQQIQRSGFAVVSGRVSKVQRNRGGIWIELQDRLVLRVAPNLLGRFDSADLEALKGRQIEARGWVVDRSRRGGLQKGQALWLLPLTDPSMLHVPR